MAFLKKTPLNLIIFLLICCFLGAAYWYYQTQNYQFGNEATPVSEITEIKVPEPALKPEPIYVYFNNPAANINKLQRDISQDISIQIIDGLMSCKSI